MPERFDLAEMLAEIEEMEKIQVAGDRVRVSQDDILKMLSMKLEGQSEGGLEEEGGSGEAARRMVKKKKRLKGRPQKEGKAS